MYVLTTTYFPFLVQPGFSVERFEIPNLFLLHRDGELKNVVSIRDVRLKIEDRGKKLKRNKKSKIKVSCQE